MKSVPRMAQIDRGRIWAWGVGVTRRKGEWESELEYTDDRYQKATSRAGVLLNRMAQQLREEGHPVLHLHLVLFSGEVLAETPSEDDPDTIAMDVYFGGMSHLGSMGGPAGLKGEAQLSSGVSGAMAEVCGAYKSPNPSQTFVGWALSRPIPKEGEQRYKLVRLNDEDGDDDEL